MESMEIEKREFLICKSKFGKNELVFKWLSTQEEKDKEVICELNMFYPKFFERLKKGLKYIFTNSNECFFETFYLQPKDAWKIQKIATFLKRKNNNGNGK